MTKQKTDQEWEKWGETAPWYGVLAEKQYSGTKITAAAKKEFYKTGLDHVGMILGTVNSLDPSFRIKNAFDFGCGTGRLVFPLAAKSKKVIGVDISPSMIAEAKKNQPKEVKNVEFIVGDGTQNIPGGYNFVHCSIVFQHMNPKRGYDLTDTFLKNLEPGGFAALHYTVYDTSSNIMKKVRALRRKSKFVNMIANIYMKRDIKTPNMQMNMYDMGKLVKIFHDNGIADARILTSHPDCYVGVQIIGQKR